jgi:hypothetical protein
VSPSRRCTSVRPLPGAEAPFGPALPHASSRSTLVVSRHLDGLLRTGVTGLLHPATDQGFAAFHACHPSASPGGDSNRREQFPRRGSHPSKTFPHQQPYSHHCGRCLPAVTVLPELTHPTEAEWLTDRRPPKRATYTQSFLPRPPLCHAPRGARPDDLLGEAPCLRRGRSPVPRESIHPKSPGFREVGGSRLRRAPGSLSRGMGGSTLRRGRGSLSR